MDFYMQANAAETPPKLSTLTEKGHFTSGSPELAIPASTPGAAWFESVTAEIVNTIKELGGTMLEDYPTPEKSLKVLEKENKNKITSNSKLLK